MDGIPEYEEEFWRDTEELLEDVFCKKLGVNKIPIERAHGVGVQKGVKGRTIVAKFSSCKGKQHVLNEARCQKREDIYMYIRISPQQLQLLGKKTGRT